MHDETTYLGKWPRLIVAGDNVAVRQAAEINIRTNHWYYMHVNNKIFTRQVAEICGYELDNIGYPKYPEVKDFIREYQVLDLRYLHNHNIGSSWIGGAHGWCWWDGSVGTDSFNIGKWPTIEEVENDLTLIATRWPFLRFDMQLAADEGVGDVVAQWAVADGVWKRMPLQPPLAVPRHRGSPTENVVEDFVEAYASGFVPDERGVTLHHLREALRWTAESLREPKALGAGEATQ